MRSAVLILVVALSGVVTHSAAAQRKRGASTAPGASCADVDKKGQCAIYDVSLVALIAAPERFDGKTVRVVGYAHLAFNNTGIYLSRESFEQGAQKNGVWLELAADALTARANDLTDRYVRVTGVWNAHDFGNLGLWSGQIERVRSLEAWGRRF